MSETQIDSCLDFLYSPLSPPVSLPSPIPLHLGANTFVFFLLTLLSLHVYLPEGQYFNLTWRTSTSHLCCGQYLTVVLNLGKPSILPRELSNYN